MTLALIAMSAWSLTAVDAVDNPTKRYAVIVANNHSLDDGVAPLSYADDDGAKFYELMTSANIEVALFAVLDPDAQRRFPKATADSKPPKRDAILGAAKQMFGSMRGDHTRGIETEFYFVFSGHGGIGANREGYLNFLDDRFGRRDLYHEIIAQSPATWNHVVLDACSSYFVVEKKGAAKHRRGDYKSAVRALMRKEDLTTYPNTGVFLAASSESETHEWSRWGAGIFSHELRSGMLGGADVDNDGQVTYAEAATFVEAANSAVDDPKARLRVYARPPAARIDRPLFTTKSLRSEVQLNLNHEALEHYYIEDSRGVRVADIHPAPGAPVTLGLLGKEPFFLRAAQQEAQIPRGLTESRSLRFSPRSSAHKGSVDDSYRRNLYRVPFGLSFYQGALAVRGPALQGWDGWYGSEPAPPTIFVEEPEQESSRRMWAWLSLGGAGGAAAGGLVAGLMADDTHNKYLEATNPADALKLKKDTERQTLAANILYGTAGALAITSAVLFYLEWTADTPSVTPTGGATGDAAWVGLSGQF